MVKKRRSADRTSAAVRPAKAARRRPSRATSEREAAPAQPSPQTSAREEFPRALTIVGVGASAGGLEAFSQLLRALPDDADLAIVFVQHLSPQHGSALPTLLSAQTSLPVIQVTEGLRVEPNHVYVIPPNVQMGISGDELHISPRPEDRSQYTPIDSFFITLSESSQSRAIGVILSGTASDGALGIREIKAAGGITFAQEPDTAKYNGMPRAAIATGMVDLVLSPQGIAAKLAQLAQHPYAQLSLSTRANELTVRDDQLQEVFALLRPVSGVDFTHYKLPTIKRRLLRRMALHRVTEPERYLEVLREKPAELRALYQDLLIHVTRFFRDPASFEALASEVFPALLEGRKDDDPIRVWVSACATGEEAYSLAITLVEFLQQARTGTRVQIFATDISDPAIEHARTAVYPASIEADVSPDRLRRFFTRSDGSYRVNKAVRDLCVFARQDLVKDPPFSRLDLVLCRNVLIYMDVTLQHKLISVFHYALHPNGFLVLGQAETVGAHAGLFSLIDKKARIYRKKTGSGIRRSVDLPLGFPPPDFGPKKAVSEPFGADPTLRNEVSRVIFDRYAPAGVVVDADLQIVQFRGQTGAFLEPASGEASLNLVKMAREGLVYGLRAALQAARKSKKPVRREGLHVKIEGRWKDVNLEVVPLTASDRFHYLVLFEDAEFARKSKRGTPKATKTQRTRGATRQRERESAADLLERELAASREYLQSIIQELESANEELQSANEEVLSSNEELQSTNEELDTAKEELQSTNEELNTVNEELHARNEELSRVNSDLVNLLASVQIAIVIVTRDLRIRRFTPMAERILNLIAGDLDRPIGQIKPNIDCPDLEQVIMQAIDTVSSIERDVQDRQGRWFSLRIRPYTSIDNKIDGAVLALFDIDGLKRSELTVRLAREYADAILGATDQPFAVLEPDLRVKNANDAFCSFFGLPRSNVDGRLLADIAGEHLNLAPLLTAVGRRTDDELIFSRLRIEQARPGAPPRPLFLTGRALRWHERPDARLLLLTISDGVAMSRSEVEGGS